MLIVHRRVTINILNTIANYVFLKVRSIVTVFCTMSSHIWIPNLELTMPYGPCFAPIIKGQLLAILLVINDFALILRW